MVCAETCHITLTAIECSWVDMRRGISLWIEWHLSNKKKTPSMPCCTAVFHVLLLCACSDLVYGEESSTCDNFRVHNIGCRYHSRVLRVPRKLSKRLRQTSLWVDGVWRERRVPARLQSRQSNAIHLPTVDSSLHFQCTFNSNSYRRFTYTPCLDNYSNFFAGKRIDLTEIFLIHMFNVTLPLHELITQISSEFSPSLK